MRRWLAGLAVAALVSAPTPGEAFIKSAPYPDFSNAVLPDAVNNLLANRYGQVFFAPAYNGEVSGVACTWDATHDVGDCINSAITAASAVGGGIVKVPVGTYGYSTTMVPVNGVRVVGAGGANYGVCATRLNAINSFTGTVFTIGSDASASVVSGSGISGMCIDGSGTAAIGIELRSVNFSLFEDLYLFGVTTTGLDIDVSATANVGVMFNDFSRVYIDLLGVPSLNANGVVIGSGTASANTNRNKFTQLTVIYQDGKGIVCGNADSNKFDPAHVETTSATPGPSVHLLGHASDAGRTCRSNRFVGEFGNQNIVASHFVADTDTFPSVKNQLFINHESGAPAASVVGSATLWEASNTGYLRNRRIGLGGDAGSDNAIKFYGTTSGSIEVGVPAAAGTNTITFPAVTGTVVTEETAAWSTYTPTVACNSGTITTLGAVAGQYKVFGKTVHVEVQIPITTVGTCVGPLFVQLPVFPVSTTGAYHLHGREDGPSGVSLNAIIKSSVNTNNMLIWKYDGSTSISSGNQMNVGGTYQLN